MYPFKTIAAKKYTIKLERAPSQAIVYGDYLMFSLGCQTIFTRFLAYKNTASPPCMLC